MQHFEKIVGCDNLLYVWFLAMFTRIDILLVSENTRTDLKTVADKIKLEIEKVETIANRFDANSEINKLNESAYLKPCVVSDELFQIISECLMYTSKTLGYFDITVNSLNKFSSGISNIELDNSTRAIRFLHPDVKIDLSGFVKGAVLRAIRILLFKENIHNALINIGNSSVLAIGNHPSGSGWKVSLPDLGELNNALLKNQCLTTSGNSVSTKWPIKNPITGDPVRVQQSLSVITSDPALGEVLAKVLYMACDDEKLLILNNFDEKIKLGF